MILPPRIIAAVRRFPGRRRAVGNLRARRRWTARAKAVAVLFVGAAFFGSLTLLIATFRAERDVHSSTVQANSWIAFQLEVEHLRLLSTLDSYATGAGLTSHQDLVDRFDILWSRLPVVMNGSEAESLREVGGVTEMVGELRRELEAIEATVLALPADDTAAYRDIRERLGRYTVPIHRMVQTMTHEGGYLVLQKQLESWRALTNTYFVGTVAAAVLLIWLLLAEMWRSRRHAEQAESARIEAEFQSRSKTQFLANMSHELRTPLNAVIGFSDLMQRETFGKLGDRYRNYAGDIHDSANHLLQLINDLLDMARIEAGELELHEGRFGIGQAVTGAVRMLRDRAAAKGVALAVADPAEDLIFLGDERLFRQILINLLSNAVKFTPSGGSVTIGATVGTDGGLELQVTDTGIGIADDQVELIVKPFFQIQNSWTRRHDGVGLGLALVKTHVERHGGTLAIASELGRGTTVTCRFPAARLCSPLDLRPGAAAIRASA